MALAATSNVGFAFVSMAVQVGTFSVLARLLSPQDYGVFAFANAILVYIMHLSQRGLTSSLLRKPELSAEDFGAAYFMCASITGLMVLIIAATSAGLIWFSHGKLKPQGYMLLFMAIPLAIQILTTPALAQLQRKLAMTSINLTQIASMLVGNGITSIACAAAGLGPWSLAFGSAAGAIAAAIPTLWLGRSEVRLTWHTASVWTALKEGLQFNGLRSLDIGWLQAPTLLLGASVPAGTIGIYQRMQFLADLSMQMTVWRVSSVIYAALARRGDGSTVQKDQYRTVLMIIAALVLPIVAFSVSATREIVEVLLGPKWLAGVFTLKLLMVAFGLSTINQAAGMALEHAGRLKARSLPAALAFVGNVALLIVIPHGRPELYGWAPLLSMTASSILLHIMVGERWKDVPAILAALLPGIVLAFATTVGVRVGGVAIDATPLAGHAIPRLAAELLFGIVFNIFAVPFIAGLPQMNGLTEIFRRDFPGLFVATRHIHRIKAARG